MVADVAKLSVGREDYYLRELATDHEQYLSGHGESPGRWYGAGAASLGLEGEASPAGFQAMFEGRHPTTGELLARLVTTLASLPRLGSRTGACRRRHADLPPPLGAGRAARAAPSRRPHNEVPGAGESGRRFARQRAQLRGPNLSLLGQAPA